MTTQSEIAQRVVESILAQQLAPGERLGEQELADLFHVSRTMVREALMQLQARVMAMKFNGLRTMTDDGAGLARLVVKLLKSLRHGTLELRMPDGSHAHFGDASAGGSNPNLGPLLQGPYYAVKLYPGDIGACTGFATDASGNNVLITQAGVNYNIQGFGNVMVLGIADTGPVQSAYNMAYVEDHDNQYDIILSGDSRAVARLASIRMPSSGAYSPVYNPGGPGNDPASNPAGPFTVPSSDQTVAITNHMQTGAYVAYIEIDGPVAKNAQGQPIGTLQGPAIINNATGFTVNAYIDPNGKRFYASFPVASR